MKREGKRGIPGRWAGGLRWAFFSPAGRVRTGWALALGLALYLAWNYGSSLGLASCFSALFGQWGITAQNLSLAPAWARLVVNLSGSLVSLAVNLGTVALSALLLRGLLKERLFHGFQGKGFGQGAAAGAVMTLLAAGLFLVLDSMRVEAPLSSARLSWEMALLLPVHLAASCAEEAFHRTFVLRTVRRALPEKSWAGVAAAAVSALILLLTSGSLRTGILGLVNLWLMGFLCALLSLKGCGDVSLGLRFAWSYCVVAVVNFPGGNIATAPLLKLYHVSEAWLTGGGAGLIAGLWTTAALCIGIALTIWRGGALSAGRKENR